MSAAAPPSAAPLDKSTWLKDDLAASVVVFLVALPLCLGIALASGAPLLAGVVAGVVGGLVVAPMSGSQLLVSGPAAGLTAIVIAAIAELGGFQPFLAAVVIAGAMQAAIGIAGWGIVSYYVPSSVIKGMLAGIGLILIMKQLPHAVGYDADAMGDETTRTAEGTIFDSLAAIPSAIEWGAVLIAAISLGILVLWERPALKKLLFLPGPLAVVVVGTLLNVVLGLANSPLALGTSHLVQLPGTSQLFDEMLFPEWSALAMPATWKVAITLAIVASLETLLSMEATDKIDPLKRQSPPNKELIAQGAGNAVSGLLGGLPITGVIVRSSANIDAGAKTKRSAIAHAVLLGGAVLLIPGLLSYIPLAALAAILLYTGYKLANPKLFRVAWRLGKQHFIPFVVTIVAILATDLLVGIGIGLAVGFFQILKDHAAHAPMTRVSPDGAVLQRYVLGDQATFLGKASLSEFLQSVKPGSRVEIDGRQARRIDYDIAELLTDFRATARANDIDYRLVGIPDVTSTPAH
jgi:MFS superfamily sulfate permease-like transporter